MTIAYHHSTVICSRRILLLLTILALFLLLTLLLGAAVETSYVNKTNTTLDFYSTPDVCGVSPLGELSDHPSVDAAHAKGDLVVHCGNCGACSNNEDVTVYEDTRSTLTDTATGCATKAFVWGEGAVYECFEEEVGFTPACNDCWTENVVCDLRKCVFTCLKMIIFGGANNNEEGGLNDCLRCDERRCGPAYIECAGANRRRSGIVSAIGRDEGVEVCRVVDDGWKKRFPISDT